MQRGPKRRQRSQASTPATIESLVQVARLRRRIQAGTAWAMLFRELLPHGLAADQGARRADRLMLAVRSRDQLSCEPGLRAPSAQFNAQSNRWQRVPLRGNRGSRTNRRLAFPPLPTVRLQCV
jgi:hypothetical protein